MTDDAAPDAETPDADPADVSAPGDAVPDDAVPDDAVPGDGVPDDGVPDDAVPGDGVPDEGVPDEGVPDDEAPDGSESDDPDGPVEEVDYDVAEWSGESRTLLDAMLSSNGIGHVWQGTNLIVSPDDESAVDDIIDQVLASATAALDPELDKIVYEVGAWSAALQTSLAESLTIAEIPFEWNEDGDLVVYSDDEDRVEEILEAMPDPDDDELSNADEGIDVQDVLGRLWVATAQLAKDPTDSDGVLGTVAAANDMDHLALPFGFEPAVWRNLVEQATQIRDALDADEPDVQLDDDELIERCTSLRDQLRPLV